ncbi:hypothetical protein GCM10010124_25020 [Pilimelia terevasa]|uniref:Peptidase inhibitor family I36 n=1 Tax=Pilimelia terevasa TaxID=53372 RepID=A0A8J3BUX7_9ACTN|nr:peptidase inhibitor family I36 protein [Pilimelia terevasa]GGK31202.1 hypothetical protein GCM10010124_25020 [Pilimelia terevasa]
MKRNWWRGSWVVILGATALTTPTAASGAGRESVRPCPDGALCIYEHANYQGELVTLSTCGVFNLVTFKLSTGKPWNDQASSYLNRRPAGTWSHLYDYDGSGDASKPENWQHLFSSRSDGDDPVEGWNHIHPNDTVDIVHVC